MSLCSLFKPKRSDGIVIGAEEIKGKFSLLLKPKAIQFLDNSYKTYDNTIIRKLLDSWKPPWKYIPQLWDCDDDARDFLNLLRSRLLGCAAFIVEGRMGILSARHVWIVYVSKFGDVLAIDPRPKWWGLPNPEWQVDLIRG